MAVGHTPIPREKILDDERSFTSLALQLCAIAANREGMPVAQRSDPVETTRRGFLDAMPALFPKWATVVLRTSLVFLVLLPVVLIGGLMIYVRTAYNTEENRAPDQPVEFDHRHHARDDGIRCLYCHSSAESTPYAGVPSSDLCMGCHNQIWSQSPLLDPVRRSYFSGTPIRWQRVHDLADFVYFDHSVHVRNGVDCVHCHGQVDQMARVYRVQPLQMQWCLDCHRDPKATLARYPKETELDRTGIQTTLDPTLPTGRGITRLTTCTACHR